MTGFETSKVRLTINGRDIPLGPKLTWFPPERSIREWTFTCRWFAVAVRLPRRWKRGQKRTSHDRRRARRMP